MPSVGNPPQPLTSLPGTALEADAIAQNFGARPLTGAQATKSTVLAKLPEARLVHFATHGILEDIEEFGSPGAIALAPSPVDSGWLTSQEIQDLALQAELVVLSACDTGGDMVTSDGVVGLTRAFFIQPLWHPSGKCLMKLRPS